MYAIATQAYRLGPDDAEEVFQDFLCALHKNSIRGAGGGEKNRAFFRHLGVEGGKLRGYEF